jgi:hypothetical protein
LLLITSISDMTWSWLQWKDSMATWHPWFSEPERLPGLDSLICRTCWALARIAQALEQGILF